MTEKNIWENIEFSNKKEKSAYDYLNEQKGGLFRQTGGELKMDIEAVDAYIDSNPTPIPAAIYILYIVAPKLGNFRRKVLSVAEYNPSGCFPVDVINHLNDNIKKTNISEANFLDEIAGILSSHNVRTSIQNLYQQSKEHGTNIGFDVLDPGHAGVLLLKDGSTMNYGVIKIEGAELVHYTGKGLREIAEGKQKELDSKTIEENILNESVVRTPLTSILKILS